MLSTKGKQSKLGDSFVEILEFIHFVRYICLTSLIPKIPDMVDEGKIAFSIAVELSCLKEEEQYELHAVMNLEQCTLSFSQAKVKRTEN